MRGARYSVGVDDDLGELVGDALGILLRRDARARLYRGLTEGLGAAVDPVTYPVLSGLARTGSCSAADLAGRIGLDRSGVTRRASRLEDAGLLRRELDPADGRATLLALTAAGQQTVATMRRRLADQLRAGFADWPPEQARAFAYGLRRFVDETFPTDS